MGKFRDLTGQKFGRLTALSPTNKRSGSGSVIWRCRCVCGNTHETSSHSLILGHCRSCGCLQLELARAQFTHRMSRSKIYHIWASMIQRCENPKNPRFKDYGGRGIKVCKKWHSFENFYEDVGDKPENRSLDRSDNDGNYQPENCKWSTSKEQAQNSRPKSHGSAKQKEFWAISPDNQCLSCRNQAQFAREHPGLDHRLISNCLRKKQKTHKGWTFYFV